MPTKKPKDADHIEQLTARRLKEFVQIRPPPNPVRLSALDLLPMFDERSQHLPCSAAPGWIRSFWNKLRRKFGGKAMPWRSTAPVADGGVCLAMLATSCPSRFASRHTRA